MTPFDPWHVVVHLHSTCVGCRLACMRCVLDSRALCAAAQAMLMTVVGGAGLDLSLAHPR
jgi:hypothetical protein